MPQLGDYNFKTIRAAAILTNSYVAGNVIGLGATADQLNVHEENQLIIYVDFTIGSLTDGRIKVEFAHDATTPDYYQESFSSISGGTDTVTVAEHKFTGTGKYRIAIPIKDNSVKISAIGTGAVTNSSMKISAAIGMV